jgi:hypothetical protein
MCLELGVMHCSFGPDRSDLATMVTELIRSNDGTQGAVQRVGHPRWQALTPSQSTAKAIRGIIPFIRYWLNASNLSWLGLI